MDNMNYNVYLPYDEWSIWITHQIMIVFIPKCTEYCIFLFSPNVFYFFENQPWFFDHRSGRERGLHERATRAGLALPCPITWISIPMKRSSEDDTLELTQWPILQPFDFVSRPRYIYI